MAVSLSNSSGLCGLNGVGAFNDSSIRTAKPDFTSAAEFEGFGVLDAVSFPRPEMCRKPKGADILIRFRLARNC